MSLSAVGICQRFAQTDLQIGGDSAYYCVNDTDTGPFIVMTESNNQMLAVLPSLNEAKRVASYAITPAGGYGAVVVLPAAGKNITHNDFQAWLFD